MALFRRFLIKLLKSLYCLYLKCHKIQNFKSVKKIRVLKTYSFVLDFAVWL